MKVICIDGQPRHYTSDVTKMAKEGCIYTPVGEAVILSVPAYKLAEFPNDDIIQFWFAKDRFIPLSEIDEMELVNEKQLPV